MRKAGRRPRPSPLGPAPRPVKPRPSPCSAPPPGPPRACSLPKVPSSRVSGQLRDPTHDGVWGQRWPPNWWPGGRGEVNVSGSRYSPPCPRSHRRLIYVLLHQTILISEEREGPLSCFNSCFPASFVGPAGFWVVGVPWGCVSVPGLLTREAGAHRHTGMSGLRLGFALGGGSKEACPLWG